MLLFATKSMETFAMEFLAISSQGTCPLFYENKADCSVELFVSWIWD